MTQTTLADRLAGLLEPIAAEHGLDLCAVEVAGSARSPIVRVFLDREGGIDIEAVTSANSWVKDLLDAQPETADRYTLEVSSPGIERPLRSKRDYERFAGSAVKITTSTLVEGRKSFTGTLEGMSGDSVVLSADGATYHIPLEAVAKARLHVVFDFNKEGLDGI